MGWKRVGHPDVLGFRLNVQKEKVSHPLSNHQTNQSTIHQPPKHPTDKSPTNHASLTSTHKTTD